MDSLWAVIGSNRYQGEVLTFKSAWLSLRKSRLSDRAVIASNDRTSEGNAWSSRWSFCTAQSRPRIYPIIDETYRSQGAEQPRIAANGHGSNSRQQFQGIENKPSNMDREQLLHKFIQSRLKREKSLWQEDGKALASHELHTRTKNGFIYRKTAAAKTSNCKRGVSIKHEHMVKGKDRHCVRASRILPEVRGECVVGVFMNLGDGRQG
jgi:hypothetical protein